MQNFIMRLNGDFAFRLGVLLLVCIVAGCSALRLGYANGDTVLYWWLNGYVDFTAEQKPWVRKHINTLFVWHRQTQLKDYARLLSQLQDRLGNPVTPTDVQNEMAAVRQRALIVLDKALPSLADLALSLEPDQLSHLQKKFASNNESYRKEYLRGSVEDRQRLRFKKVMKQAEYWFGDFSAEQEARIRAASDARPLDYEIWMAERLARQEEMIRMLKRIQSERPSRDAASAMLRTFVLSSLDNFTYAEHRTFFDGTRDGMARMIATIIDLATPAQREHARQRLQKWIEDCRELAAR